MEGESGRREWEEREWGARVGGEKVGGEKGSGEKGREMRRKGDEHEQAWARKTFGCNSNESEEECMK